MVSLVSCSFGSKVCSELILGDVKFEDGLLKCNLYSYTENLKIPTNIIMNIRGRRNIDGEYYPVKNKNGLTFIIERIFIDKDYYITDANLYIAINKLDIKPKTKFKICKDTDINKLNEVEIPHLTYDVSLDMDLSNLKCDNCCLINKKGLNYYYVDFINKQPKYNKLHFVLDIKDPCGYKQIYELISIANKVKCYIIYNICDKDILKNYSDENLIYLYKINYDYIRLLEINEISIKEIENRNLTGYIFRQKSARSI